MEIYIIRDSSEIKIKDSKSGWTGNTGYLAWKPMNAADFIMEAGALKITSEQTKFRYSQKNIQQSDMVKRLKPCSLNKIKAEKHDDGFLLLELLQSDIKDDPAANRMLESLTVKPQTIVDSVIGELFLDKKNHDYRSTVDYEENMGFHIQKFEVWLSVPGEAELPTARILVEKFAELVPEAIEFATQKLAEEVEEPEYMWIRYLDVHQDGDYTLRFDYEPEYAHDAGVNIEVFVHGNITRGFEDAKFFSSGEY